MGMDGSIMFLAVCMRVCCATLVLLLSDCVLPTDLSFDWGVATIAPISGWTDPRNLITLAAYVGVVGLVAWLLLRRNSAGL